MIIYVRFMSKLFLIENIYIDKMSDYKELERIKMWCWSNGNGILNDASMNPR